MTVDRRQTRPMSLSMLGPWVSVTDPSRYTSPTNVLFVHHCFFWGHEPIMEKPEWCLHFWRASAAGGHLHLQDMTVNSLCTHSSIAKYNMQNAKMCQCRQTDHKQWSAQRPACTQILWKYCSDPLTTREMRHMDSWQWWVQFSPSRVDVLPLLQLQKEGKSGLSSTLQCDFSLPVVLTA